MVRNGDASKVDIILNNPKVEEMYQKEGLKEIYFDTNPPNSSLAEGNLQKKGKYRKNWSSRYLVLDRFGFLYTYDTKTQFEGDTNGMTGAAKKIIQIDDVLNTNPDDYVFKVTDHTKETRVYKANTSDEKAM